MTVATVAAVTISQGLVRARAGSCAPEAGTRSFQLDLPAQACDTVDPAPSRWRAKSQLLSRPLAVVPLGRARSRSRYRIASARASARAKLPSTKRQASHGTGWSAPVAVAQAR